MAAASLDPDAVRAALAARPGEEPTAPVGALLLGCLRLYAADADLADRPAQVDSSDGRSLSFSALLTEAVRAAAGWRALGLRPGHRLATYSWNRLDLFPAILGAMFEGITIVSVEPFASKDELRHYFSLLPLDAVLCERTLLRSALAEAEPGVRIVVLGDLGDADLSAAAEAREAVSLDEMLCQGEALGLDAALYQPPAVADVDDHVVAVSFSSGTSGLPKGILRKNRGFTVTMFDARGIWRGPAGSGVLLQQQVSVALGLVMAVTSAARAITAVLHNYKDERCLLDVMERFETFAAHCKETGWSMLSTPARTALLAQLVEAERAARKDGSPRLPHLKFIRTLGGILSPAVHRQAEEALGVPVLQLYGCNECGTIAGYTQPGGARSDSRPVKPTCTGYVVPGVDLKLVDVVSGREVVERGGLGEVRVKTPTMMAGYVDGTPAFDEEGYYCTGDVAFMDEDGGLHVVDRVKEILKFDAFQVAPAEVEAVLVSHPAVREACVVGRKHPRYDTLPTAFVALRPGASATERELQDLVKDTLTDHKRLRGGVFFVSEIPKAPSGKPLRRALRDRVEDLPPVRDEDLE